MTPGRIVALIVAVFGVTLPFTYILNHGLPTQFTNSWADFDDNSNEIDDPVLDALCLKAVIYLNNEQYEKAIGAYSEAIQRNPKFSLAYIGRGDVYLAKNDYDRAITDYEQASRLDPRNEELKRRVDVVREVRAGR
jgi:tetratricopeptide (TPR) repeat protein